MKRHPSLAPLSREHHPALVLAQLLKKDAPPYKGLPAAVNDKAAYAEQLFHSELEAHFRKEENLLAKVAFHHPEIITLAKEIEQEHRQLAAAFAGIQLSADKVNDLDDLGRKLEQHIRKEERVLFPLLEKICAPQLLQEIAVLLT